MGIVIGTETAIALFILSVPLFILGFKKQSKIAFFCAFVVLFLPTFREILLSFFPWWVSVLVTLLVFIVMIRIVLTFFFGETTDHIMGDLVSSAIKEAIKMLIYIPKKILSSNCFHSTSSKLGTLFIQAAKSIGVLSILSGKGMLNYLNKNESNKIDTKDDDNQ